MWAGNDITKSTWYSNYPSADESAMDDYVTMNDYVTMSDDGGMDGTDQYTDMADAEQDAINSLPEHERQAYIDAAKSQNKTVAQLIAEEKSITLAERSASTLKPGTPTATSWRSSAIKEARRAMPVINKYTNPTVNKSWFQKNPVLSVVLAGGAVIGAVTLFSKMSRR